MLDGVAADPGHAVIWAVHVNGDACFLTQGAHECEASLPVRAPSPDKHFDVGLTYGICLLPHGLQRDTRLTSQSADAVSVLQKMVKAVVVMKTMVVMKSSYSAMLMSKVQAAALPDFRKCIKRNIECSSHGCEGAFMLGQAAAGS